jgi:hypothetical protein
MERQCGQPRIVRAGVKAIVMSKATTRNSEVSPMYTSLETMNSIA